MHIHIIQLIFLQRIADEIISRDPGRLGNRGPYRWSLGSAFKTGHMLHIPEVVELIDLPTITSVLTVLYTSLLITFKIHFAYFYNLIF